MSADQLIATRLHEQLGPPVRRRKVPRDTQRKRLTDAEDAAARATGGHVYAQSIANADLQAWVDAALARRAICTRWPGMRITVGLKRGGSAYGYRDKRRISLPAWARNEWVILHEIAHVLTPGRYTAHGPEFAGVYLFLVRTVLGPEAGAALLAQYRTKPIVRHNRAAIPAPQDVPTLAEQVAAKVARQNRPVGIGEAADAAATLRRAARTGMFGAPGTKTRSYALAAARMLEAHAGRRPAAARTPRRNPR